MSKEAPDTPTVPRGRADRGSHQVWGLVLGPVVAVLVLAVPPEGLSQGALRVAAVGLCMAIWWATEAIPPAVTALVPVAFFPLLGITDVRAVTAPYAHPNIFLFLGGFIMAAAVERQQLHRRIALWVLSYAGGTGGRLVGGFMAASALLSMWLTNTATAVMLMPIALSVVVVVQQNLAGYSAELDEQLEGGFPVAMLLGVAYGASIGGVATLIGTPPNTLLAAFVEERHGITIGFGQWMLVGLPMTLILLPITWWLLTRRLYRVDFETRGAAMDHLAELRRGLGAMSPAEKRVAVIFAALALGWTTRKLLNSWPPLAGLTDAGLAMLAAVVLFLVPRESWNSPPLLDWRAARDLPWGILLLFGGGLSLAASVSDTGLAEWLGLKIVGFGVTDTALLALIVAATVIFLTELTSNTATTATFLPVIAGVATTAGSSPLALLAPVALAASCAFMLPVATPPNAVVYGSGKLTIPDMVRAGFWLNLLSILLVTAVAVLLAPRLLG